jgi:hypothetical protein
MCWGSGPEVHGGYAMVIDDVVMVSVQAADLLQCPDAEPPREPMCRRPATTRLSNAGTLPKPPAWSLLPGCRLATCLRGNRAIPLTRGRSCGASRQKPRCSQDSCMFSQVASRAHAVGLAVRLKIVEAIVERRHGQAGPIG